MANTTNKEQQPQTAEQVVIIKQSQALPALVNVFFPGIGQLIQGRVVAWLVWWLALGVSLVLTLVLVGLITTPILWIACIVDAAKYKG